MPVRLYTGQARDRFTTTASASERLRGAGALRVMAVKNSPRTCALTAPFRASPSRSRQARARSPLATSPAPNPYTRTFVSTRKATKSVLVELVAPELPSLARRALRGTLIHRGDD